MADDIVETITITTEGQDEAVQAFTDIGKASDDLAKKLGELGGADFGGIAEALQSIDFSGVAESLSQAVDGVDFSGLGDSLAASSGRASAGRRVRRGASERRDPRKQAVTESRSMFPKRIMIRRALVRSRCDRRGFGGPHRATPYSSAGRVCAI
jgi:hypothetical protein